MLFSRFWPRFCAANTAAQESQLWDSRQLPWFKMVFNRACALQKSEAPKLYQFFPKRSRFELGKIRFFSLLIWRFMASGILLQFDTRYRLPVLQRRSRFVLGKLCFSDCWFDISRHSLPVRRRPPCSGSCAHLRSHTGFTHRAGASVEVVHVTGKLPQLLFQAVQI